jgi:hypothetical protein
MPRDRSVGSEKQGATCSFLSFGGYSRSSGDRGASHSSLRPCNGQSKVPLAPRPTIGLCSSQPAAWSSGMSSVINHGVHSELAIQCGLTSALREARSRRTRALKSRHEAPNIKRRLWHLVRNRCLGGARPVSQISCFHRALLATLEHGPRDTPLPGELNSCGLLLDGQWKYEWPVMETRCRHGPPKPASARVSNDTPCRG